MSSFSVRTLADYWTCQSQLVLQLIHSGDLAATDISSVPHSRRPTYRISADEVKRFELSRRVTPPPSKPRRTRRKATTKPFYP